MIINVIAAMALNNVIGLKGKLPWNIPEDWNFFLQMTREKHVIMGRITYEELPIGKFNNWTKIVLTKNRELEFDDAIKFSNLREAIAELGRRGIQEVFIIGGVIPFREGLSIGDNLYLTLIKKKFEGDRCFPIDGLSDWIIDSEENYCSSDIELKFTKWKRTGYNNA